MKKIWLSGKNGEGKYVLVDNKDYKYLNRLKWHLNSNGYAVRRPKFNGQSKTIYMHRLIMKTPNNLFIDHVNRNRLDNRRENLQNVSWAENRLNIGKHKDNKRGERNIDFVKKYKHWRVRIQRYGECVFQSYHSTLQGAILSRNEYYARREN